MSALVRFFHYEAQKLWFWYTYR